MFTKKKILTLYYHNKIILFCKSSSENIDHPILSQWIISNIILGGIPTLLC